MKTLTIILVSVLAITSLYDVSWARTARFTGSDIQNNSITGRDIENRSITGVDIKNGSLRGADLADRTIGSSKIAGAAIGSSEIADGAVTAAKMSSNNCSSGQILKYNGSAWACAEDDNTGSSIGNTVESAEIADGTITDSDIADSASIASSKINFSGNTMDMGNAKLTFAQSGSNPQGIILTEDILTTHNRIGIGAYTDINGSNNSTNLNMHGSHINFYRETDSGDNNMDSSSIYLNDLKQLQFNSYSNQGFYFSGGGGAEGNVKLDSITPLVLGYGSGTYKASLLGTSLAGPNGGVTITNSTDNATVHVKNMLKLEPAASDPDTCDASNEGLLYYNSTTHKLMGCNGTTWTAAW